VRRSSGIVAGLTAAALAAVAFLAYQASANVPQILAEHKTPAAAATAASGAPKPRKDLPTVPPWWVSAVTSVRRAMERGGDATTVHRSVQR